MKKIIIIFTIITLFILSGCKLNTSVDKIIRKNEEIYKKLSLKDADENTLIEQISQNPILLERPIVVKGEKAIIGRPPENVKDLF